MRGSCNCVCVRVMSLHIPTHTHTTHTTHIHSLYITQLLIQSGCEDPELKKLVDDLLAELANENVSLLEDEEEEEEEEHKSDDDTMDVDK